MPALLRRPGARELTLFLVAYLLYSARPLRHDRRRRRRRPTTPSRSSTSSRRWPRRRAGRPERVRRHVAALWLLNHLYLAAQLIVVPGRAGLALPALAHALRAAAQHRAGDLAGRAAGLRAVPGRAPAARRHRAGRHDHDADRRRARLQADHVVLQRVRGGPEPARGLRRRRQRRARGRRHAAPRDGGCAWLWGPLVASPSSPPATTSSPTSWPASRSRSLGYALGRAVHTMADRRIAVAEPAMA